MATASLNADLRTESGKGVARALRRAGKIPAVVYGRGREAEALVVDALTIERLLTKVRAGTTLLDVAVAGRPPIKALIREIQRSPVRPIDILHLDLYEVHADEQISIEVPIKFVGTADGVRNGGGVFEAVTHQVEVLVLPGDIPEYIEVDVNDLAVGHSIHVSEIKFANGEMLTDGAVTLCTVVTAKVEEAPAVDAEVAVGAEPELIRKAKPDDEEGEDKE